MPPGAELAGRVEDAPWADRTAADTDPNALYPWQGVQVGGNGQLNGQALGNGVNYLSDLTYTSATNGYGPIEKDKSNGDKAAGDGKTLTIGGVTYPKGLGVHANSTVVYTLTSACSTFSASVGVDDEVGNNGNVIFQVFADGTKLYDSGVLTGADAAKAVNVNISGKTELKLFVDSNATPSNDHADWANAQVNCSAPTPTTETFVSDLSPSAATNGYGPVEKDKSNGGNQANDGKALTLRGKVYAKGWGVHANSSLTFPLNGNCSVFSAQVGIDDEVTGQGSVIFRVLADGTTLYDSGVVNGSDAVKAVNVDVTNKQNLQLVVDNNGVSSSDHADWADAKLVCKATTPPPPPADSTTTYLSDLTPSAVTNGYGPVEKDKSNGGNQAGDGKALTLRGKVFAKGWGVHANASLSFPLKDCTTFSAQVGVDDEVAGQGSVIFQVYGDSTKLYDSGAVTGTDAAKAVNVNLTGKTTLRLVVDSNGALSSDHADWADAKVVCKTVTDVPEPVNAVVDTKITAPTLFLGGESFFSADGSTGDDLTYAWDFGDGAKVQGDYDTAGKVSHSYTTPGYKTASLQVTDKVTGKTSTASIPVAVLPEVHNLPSTRALNYGQSVTLDVKYHVQGLTYQWTLSDGTVLKGAKVTPKFTKRGFQDINLTIYDDRPVQGGQPPAQRPVLEDADTRVNQIVPRPYASISGSQTNVSTITLSGQSSQGATGTTLTYAWDFGDGTTGTGVTVSHTYLKRGRYALTLTVTDSFGQKDIGHQVVTIGFRGSATAPNIQMGVSLSGTGVQAQSLRQRPTVSRSLAGANRFELGPPVNHREILNVAGQDRTATGTISAQALQPLQIDIGYPYVFPRNPGYIKTFAIPDGLTSTFNTGKFKTSLNGVLKSPGAGWDFAECTGVVPNRNCQSAEFTRTFYPTQLKEGINHHIVNFQDANVDTTIDTDFATFTGLRVPRVALSIVPDAQLPDAEVREYSIKNATTGRSEFFVQVNVPESAVTADGQIGFAIPMYAVDASGRVMTEVSGAFDAFFADTRFFSETREGVMVRGRTEMYLQLPVATFSNSTTQFDLTQVVVTRSGADCNPNFNDPQNFGSAGFFFSGCQTMTASYDEPLSGSGSSSSSTLSAQATSVGSFLLPYPILTVNPQYMSR